MPNSFLLYQEQEMAALNYAGIDMSDCYTAIKNIAKKRADKVLAYKDKFTQGFAKTIVANEGKTEKEANDLAQNLWQIIEDSARYSFNASHSYCVALDSLYGAWLKAHHPLEFYEVLITLSEEKGDKDKMNALKAEAEDYFGIKFPPFRFGQDNRSIKCNNETNTIVNSIGAIKGYGSTIGAILYDCSLQNFEYFTDVLRYLDNRTVKAAKVRPLICIDYFNQYGNINELLTMLDTWEFFKQGEAKTIRKDKVTSPILQEILKKNCSSLNKDGSESASFKVNDNAMQCLYDFETYIKNNPLEDVSMKQRIDYTMEILGYTDVVTGKECDRRRLLITDCIAIPDKQGKIWAYRIGTRSLGSGKTARLTVRDNVYQANPLAVGDIIYAAELFKNQGGYWYLIKYNIEHKEKLW